MYKLLLNELQAKTHSDVGIIILKIFISNASYTTYRL